MTIKKINNNMRNAKTGLERRVMYISESDYPPLVEKCKKINSIIVSIDKIINEISLIDDEEF